jgi:MoaE-MoaD fusion protein
MNHQLQVRYFAAARELAGCASETLALAGPSISTAELRARLAELHPSLAPYLTRLKFAVNGELQHEEPALCAGDVVDVLPPVAGGAPARTGVCDAPLSIDDAFRAVSHAGAGGVALFVGVVRDHAGEQAVERLDYEAHESLAERELSRIAQAVEAEYPGSRAYAWHRVGSLQVGELAVVVAASAAHRAEAFAACRALIERIKESVPIWKKEWAADGSTGWVNLTK